MADIRELARLFQELEDQLVVCIRCGMCQSVCPVFEQTHKEADVARGKLALLNGLMARIFDDPQGVSRRLNKCLLCGSCAANCPSGVNVLEIFIRARAILAGYMGLSPAKKIIFKHMLANPKVFNTMMAMAQKFQPLMARHRSDSQGTSCARFDLPLVGHRHFRPLAREPFHQSAPRSVSRPAGSSVRVVLFTGCLIDKILPGIAHAVVKTMSHHKVDLIIPENQGCCGIPALASGDRQTFQSLVQHHAALLEQVSYDYLVTACATCTSTIKKLWPALSKETGTGLTEQLGAISEKTMDISQFLVDIAGVSPGTAADTASPQACITYHDPCHLKKSLGIHTQPRQLITAAGHRIREMAEADKCCGMGGSFNLFHYDISSRIGTLKAQHIMDTGCSTLATGCPACIMQISDMLSKQETSIRVRHPVEIYADSIKTRPEQ